MSEQDQKKAEAKERILQFFPHLRYAVKMAIEGDDLQGRPPGNAHFAVVSVPPEGLGSVISKFDTAFLEDIALLLDVPPQTEDSEMDAAAAYLVGQIRVRGAKVERAENERLS